MAKGEKFAVRNLRLCTKDCLCLYVCPYGATDTENSIIDVDKCTGCGACAEACPSGAISMVPYVYPAQQPKKVEVLEKLDTLSLAKAEEQQIARQVQAGAGEGKGGLFRLMTAAEMSMRLVHEDIMRESGYMLPQSKNAQSVLSQCVSQLPTSDFPAAEAMEILERIPCNE